MRRLLIVDDEKNIRIGLKAMIERQYPDAYRIGLARHGREALQELERSPYDLIITDIRMPMMDGLQLLEHLSREPNPPQVIMLSGHDDFHYCKEALRNGAADYLLKPIQREELFRALDKAGEALERQAENRSMLDSAERLFAEYRVSQLHYVLLNRDMPLPELKRVEAAIRFADVGSPYRVLVFKPAGSAGRSWSGEELASAVKHLWSGGTPAGDEVGFIGKEGHYVLITAHEERVQAIAEALRRERRMPLAAGISRPAVGLESLRLAHAQAVEAWTGIFIEPKHAVMFHEEPAGLHREYTPPLEEVHKLANMLGTDRDKELRALLYDLFDQDKLIGYGIAYLEELRSLINERVIDDVFRVHGAAPAELLASSRDVCDIFRFSDAQTYVKALEQFLLNLSRYVSKVRQAHSEREEMKEAIRYIREHYGKPLTMAMVSNHVSLSYTYFSEAFKQYTGDSFVNYVKKVRLEEAKRMLAETNDKIADISHQVGYEHVKQFNRVFKELEGITPHEYRRKQKSERFRGSFAD